MAFHWHNRHQLGGYKKRTVFIVITLFIEPDEHQMLRCHKFAFVGV